ncbi:response regulator transcription factor [Rhizobium sp. BK376]|uniref:winged helix-turn-helix transcriptional regulator n=1 Tax=Rhizobium sp. BK376 TaxID=2512149 RepID=UPI0010EEA1A8|nr:response regulator transcription factor [Rhizobium sp. BK376]TCR80851.1 two-component system phosphate regulon response regulator PhoB [Rhizobium sp. BK376]
MKARAAILSADADYVLLLSHVLSIAGFGPVFADTVEQAMALAHEGDVIALLIDCRPGSSILSDLSRQLRDQGPAAHAPVVALVAEGVPYVEVLKSAVDETFIRPMKPEQLLAYLHARQGHPPGATELPAIRLQFDDGTRQVGLDGRTANISPIEYRIVKLLAGIPGRVFSRADIVAAGWPARNFVDLRTVDVHVARLRKTLRDLVGRDLIRTVRGEGYVIDL